MSLVSSGDYFWDYNSLAFGESGQLVVDFELPGEELCYIEGNQLQLFIEGDGCDLYSDVPVLHVEFQGCTDENACNYGLSDCFIPTFDDGSCDYEGCVGCMDESGANFDPAATLEGTCIMSATIPRHLTSDRCRRLAACISMYMFQEVIFMRTT